jgi:hypothetical protein
MLKKEDFVVIEVLTEHGVYQKDIADKLGVHPKTVSRALKRGSAPVKVRKGKTSKLEPYKPMIDRLLSEGVWNAVVILREVQAVKIAATLSRQADGSLAGRSKNNFQQQVISIRNLLSRQPVFRLDLNCLVNLSRRQQHSNFRLRRSCRRDEYGEPRCGYVVWRIRDNKEIGLTKSKID